MRNSLRIAIVGCGAIAGNHVRGVLSSDEKLCALCDILPAQAERLIEKYQLGEIPVYTNYTEMLDAVKPDAVHICTPHYLHVPMSIEALERGIHVLCEKPLAISIEQLVQLREAVKNSNAQLGVCMQNRYEPNLLRAKELAQKEGIDAAFGDVVWKRDADYYASGDWRGSWEKEGGGVMINQALHTLDLLQWICGMPTYVTAHTANDHLRGVIEVEDTASARFECPDGSLFNFFATTAANKSFPAHLRFFLSNKQTLHAETDLVTLGSNALELEKRENAVGKSVWGNGHAVLIRDFYRHVKDGTPFPINEKEGEKVVRLILSMYASDGKRIEILE